MENNFTVGTFAFNLPKSFFAQAQIKSVFVNGRVVTLFRFPGVSDKILSNRPSEFDIRDDGNQVNQRLRQAWCHLTGTRYKDLMAEVDKQRRANAQEEFENRLLALHASVTGFEAYASRGPFYQRNNRALMEIESAVGRLIRRAATE